MNESIYAPPEADIAVEPEGGDDFFVVSAEKFLIMTIITANLYSLYWNYRQWRSIKQRDGSKIMPIPRAIFAVFFTHSLCARFRDSLSRRGISHPWQPMLTASLVVGYYLFSLSWWVLPDTVTLTPGAVIVSTAATPLLAVLLLPAQKAANAATGDPSGSGNSQLSGANWVWLIIGSLLWLMTFFNLYLVINEPELFQAL